MPLRQVRKPSKWRLLLMAAAFGGYPVMLVADILKHEEFWAMVDLGCFLLAGYYLIHMQESAAQYGMAQGIAAATPKDVEKKQDNGK